MLVHHSIPENFNFVSLCFQARKYGYLVEICEPNTVWRLKASQLAKYIQFCFILFHLKKFASNVTVVITEQASSVPSQEIRWEERLQNDQFCVEWNLRP